MTRTTRTGAPIAHTAETSIVARLPAAHGGHAAMEYDLRHELRADAPCGLAAVPDEEIAVDRTAGEGGLLTYRASVPCAEPGCVAFAREQQWVRALHRLLDGAGERDLTHDPLERALAEFEAVYVWAARQPTPQRLERAERWRPELARLAAARFPGLPALVPAVSADGSR